MSAVSAATISGVAVFEPDELDGPTGTVGAARRTVRRRLRAPELPLPLPLPLLDGRWR
jgi:hypothetical protein